MNIFKGGLQMDWKEGVWGLFLSLQYIEEIWKIIREKAELFSLYINKTDLGKVGSNKICLAFLYQNKSFVSAYFFSQSFQN